MQGSLAWADDMLHSARGVPFMDFDNDGWKDLLIARGHVLDTVELNFPQLRYREPMLLASNTGTVSWMFLR
jgi:hypothetical protein